MVTGVVSWTPIAPITNEKLGPPKRSRAQNLQQGHCRGLHLRHLRASRVACHHAVHAPVAASLRFSSRARAEYPTSGVATDLFLFQINASRIPAAATVVCGSREIRLR